MFDLYEYGYHLIFWVILVPLVLLTIFISIIAVIISLFSGKKSIKKLSNAELLDSLISNLKSGKADAKSIKASFESFKARFSDFSKHKLVDKSCEFLQLITQNDAIEIEAMTHFRDELVAKNSDAKDAIQKAVNTALKERDKHKKGKK